MKNMMQSAAYRIIELIKIKPVRRTAYLVLLLILAFADYTFFNKDRISLPFFRYSDSQIVVEDRLLSRSGNQEDRLGRYIEELLLGPSKIENGPLFLPGTKVHSLMLRSGIAYINLSEHAALPVPGGMDHRKSLEIFRKSIQKNVPGIKKVVLFIDGNQPYSINFSSEDVTDDENK